MHVEDASDNDRYHRCGFRATVIQMLSRWCGRNLDVSASEQFWQHPYFWTVAGMRDQCLSQTLGKGMCHIVAVGPCYVSVTVTADCMA
jgi:hypothetical protein